MNRRTLVTAAALVFMVLSAGLPLSAQKAAAPGRSGKTASTGKSASTEIVNLNTATAAEIAKLPGIGQKTADLIVEYRTKNGAFKKVEEIMNVKGVGEKSFLKLKDRLTVAPTKAS